MKTAFLVDFSIRTRIIIDVPEGTDPETATYCNSPLGDAIAKAAVEKISANAKSYLEDNMVEIMEDTECPYPCGVDEDREKADDEWFAQADFRTMEEMFNIRHEDFNEADGYQDFVDECERRWKKLDPAAKDFFHKKNS